MKLRQYIKMKLEEVSKEKEEERKDKAERCRKKEEQHKAREDCFDEWERIQVYIRQLHKVMKNETDEEQN